MDHTTAGLTPAALGSGPASAPPLPATASTHQVPPPELEPTTTAPPVEALGFTSEVFAAAYPDLRRLAGAVAPPGVEPDELVQEAVARMLARVRRSRPVDQPSAYLARTIINLARSRRRSWATRRRLTAPPPRLVSSPPPEPDRVDELLDALPVRQRACLWLRFVEDRSVDETAQLLGCTSGTVKSQTAKALASLRRSGLVHPEPDPPIRDSSTDGSIDGSIDGSTGSSTPATAATHEPDEPDEPHEPQDPKAGKP